MRSDNLRAAPHWITADLVKRVLDVAMPVGGESMPVATIPMPGMKPRLAIVPKANTETPKPPVTHSRRPEEREAAINGPASAASPRRTTDSSSAGRGTPLAGTGTASHPVDAVPALRSKKNSHPTWTPEEDEQLRQAYERGERIDLVAEQLGRAAGAAYTRATKIGLSHPREIKGGFITNPKWTAAEDELLKALYGEIPTSELPALIGRSKIAIFNRAHQLNLHHGYLRQWTRKERKALKIGHERGLAIADVAAALGRKAFSVSKYATNNGLSYGRRPLLAQPIDLDTILALENPAQPLPIIRDCAAAARAASEELTAQRAIEAGRREAGKTEARRQREIERAAALADRQAGRQKNCEVTPPAISRPAVAAPSREPAPILPQARAQTIVVRQTPGAPRYISYAERMTAALAHLRARNFVIQRHNRDEIIARWRVCGWSGLFSNEQLVLLAEHHGLELRAGSPAL